MPLNNFELRGFDRTGILLSILCLVHCVMLPALIAVAAIATPLLLPNWLQENETVHAFLLVAVLLVSGPVLLRGGRNRAWIAIMGAIGLLLLIAAFFIENASMEQVLTSTGAFTLVIAHLMNIRTRRRSCAAGRIGHIG